MRQFAELLISEDERCGFIMPDGALVEVENHAEDPKVGFRMDPADVIQFEDKAWGTFHTHPGSTSNLSGEDYRAFQNYPHLRHVIIGEDGFTCYIVTSSGKIVKDEAKDLPSRSPEVSAP